jgi:hypothetical protein
MKFKYLTAILSLLIISATAVAQQVITSSTTVLPYINISISYDTLDFDTIYVNTQNKAPTNLNQNNGEFNATISTNYDYKISVKVVNLPSGFTHKFNCNSTVADATNLNYATTLTDTYQVIFTRTGVTAGTYTDYHANWLSVGFVTAKEYSWSLYELYENL